MNWQMEYFITESGSCPLMKYHKEPVYGRIPYDSVSSEADSAYPLWYAL